MTFVARVSSSRKHRTGRGLAARMVAIVLHPRSSTLRRSFRSSAFAAQVDAACGKALSDLVLLHAGAGLLNRMAGRGWLSASVRGRLAEIAARRHARFAAIYGPQPFLARRRLYDEKVRHLPLATPGPAVPPNARRLCVALHAYYLDTAEDILSRLRHVSRPFDLLVATPAGQVEAVSELCSRLLPQIPVRIIAARNRGRNFGPMLVEMADAILGYDLLLHLHTKQSLRTGRVQAAWCNHILDHLVGSPEVVEAILRAFTSEERLGLVGPFSFSNVPYWCHHWMANAEAADRLFARLGIGTYPRDGLLDFPAGGMFWARVEALRPLFEAGWAYEDFEPEPLPADGTLAHAIERGVTVVASVRDYVYGETDLETGVLRIGDSEKNLSAHFALVQEPVGLLFEGADSVSFAFSGTLFTPMAVHPQDVGAAAAWLYERTSRGAGRAAAARALDMAVLRPREAMLTLLRRLAAQRRHLLLVDDTGRDSDFVREVLARHGLDATFAATLRPTPDGLIRPDGILWEPAGEGKEGRRRHVHVGSDPRDDLQYAADLGYRPMPMVNATTLADLRGAMLPEGWRSRSHRWADGVLLGPLVAHIGNNPFDPSPACRYALRDAREVGYCVLGPALAVLPRTSSARSDRPVLQRLRHQVGEMDGSFLDTVQEAAFDISKPLSRLLRRLLDSDDTDPVLAGLREGAEAYVLDLVSAYGVSILAAPFDRELAFAAGLHLVGRMDMPEDVERALVSPPGVAENDAAAGSARSGSG